VSAPLLPVTVIGGYLGTGKTTLLNHILRNAGGLRIAVLVNEFGELSIDEDLIEAEDDDIISIAGGCICCSFGSDLTGALMDIAQMSPRPDHVVIESSGIAVPSAIAGSVSLLNGFRMDGIITLADAETVQRSASDKYMGDTLRRQIDDANIIILNKVDLVSNTQQSAVKDWLAQMNPAARILPTQQGKVPPETVLGSFLDLKTSSAPHHEPTNLQMTTLTISDAVDADVLAATLAAPELGLIRAKGFVTSTSGQTMLVQVVGNRWETSFAPASKKCGIVCLGFRGVMSKAALFRLGHGWGQGVKT